jgi:hypothetical protein
MGGAPQIGGGTSGLASTECLITEVDAGLHPGTFLTSAIMIHPETLTVEVEGTGDSLTDVIDLKTRTEISGVLWTTIEEAGQLADTNYPGRDTRIDGCSE